MPDRQHSDRHTRGCARAAAAGLSLTVIVLATACTSEGRIASNNPQGTRVGPDHPNVLIVMTDDQRGQGTLGVMRSTRRWFGRSGTRFTRAYATTPLCCPSRASVFTGRYAHNHGVRSNLEGSSLDLDTTVQRMLHDAGYRTAIAGKFLNRWPINQGPPSFDEFAIFTPRPKARDYFGTIFNHNGEVQSIRQYSTFFIRDRAIEFLNSFEEQDDAPWFLVVTTYAPHFPSEVPEEYESRRVPRWDSHRELNLEDKPAYVRNSTQVPGGRLRRIRRHQLRSLMPVDDMVADITSNLNLLKEDDDTLAFFLSDNGFLWGEHGSGGKATPYDPSVRIPLLVRWPTKGHPTVDPRLVATVDIAPTILRATGIALPDEPPMDGRALTSRSKRDQLLLEYWASRQYPVPSWNSLVTRNKQYTELYNQDGKVIDRELYDLRADPFQKRNLIAGSINRPSDSRIDRYHTLLKDYSACTGANCP